jgi:predicted membrane-bound spermidine synthase
VGLRAAALLLAVATGAAGLVQEVAWQRVLATLLGSHSEATAAVLALFLGGLAAGYRLLGAASRRWVASAAAAGRPARLLLRYGAIEAAIGAWALAFPALFAGARFLSALLPHEIGAVGFAFDVLLSALLVAPPAVLMGGTIPVLTQALARSVEDATRLHALVYASNTAGAFAGALAAGFWLVPEHGLVAALRFAGALNLAAGAAYAALDRAGAPAPEPEGPAAREPAAAALCAVSLLCGFAMMTVQAVLIRVGALAFGSSQLTFSMVVAVFVLCIALGSFALSALPRVSAPLLPASLWALAALLGALYLGLDAAPYWTHRLRILFRDDPAAFLPYHVAAFLGLLGVLALPVAISGATLPLLFHRLRRDAGELGDAAGRLYGWNTAGSLLGALLGGYALLFWLDLHHVFRVALAALAAAAALATAAGAGARLRLGAALSGAAALAAIAALPAWDPARLASGLFRARQPLPFSREGPGAFFARYGRGELRFYDDDPVASVALFSPEPGALAVVTNGKPDSAVPADRTTTCLAALIPAVLAQRAERAFVVGYATGVTAGELAALDGMREVQVAEISPAIARAAPLFDFANLDASRNPKVQIVPGDAYRSLQHASGRFDLIVSEPSNPWVAGVEMLYAREFLEAARARLAPGGVHAQWFHTYESDAASVAAILRSYDAVFEHSAVWYKLGLDLLLVGMPDPAPALDLGRIERRLREPDVAAGLARCGVQGLPAFLAHELLPMGVLHATPLRAEVHTLLRPRLATLAARAFFAGAEADLPPTSGAAAAAVGARNSLVRRLAARRGGRLREGERERMVRETCKHRPSQCLALLAAWRRDEPGSERLEALLDWIRRNPILSRTTPLDLLEPLAALHIGGGGQTPLPVESARRSAELFARHYHHAAPFPRSALERLWRRCEADAAQAHRCAEARAELEGPSIGAGGGMDAQRMAGRR